MAAHIFRAPEPPARTHYYLANPDLNGEDVEEFRNLAERAWRLVVGWHAHGPGLPPGIDLPTLATARKRGEAGEAEAFVEVVHRIARTSREDSQLRGEVSTSERASRGLRVDLPPGHPAPDPARRGAIDPSIPGDCTMSSFGNMDVFEASALAICAIVGGSVKDVVVAGEPEILTVATSDSESPERVPSIEEIKDVFETLWRLAQEMEADKKCCWQQEDFFLPLFGGLADALRLVRPLEDSIRGWPDLVACSLPLAIEQFDLLTNDWGWEWVEKPEPERSRYVDRQRKKFRAEVERPYYEAVLSWQKGRRTIGFPSYLESVANEGSKLGFTATMAPEEGRSAEPERWKVWNDAPRLGMAYPTFSEERKGGLLAAFNDLKRGRRMAEVGGDWQPRQYPAQHVEPVTAQIKGMAIDITKGLVAEDASVNAKDASNVPAFDLKKCPVELREDTTTVIVLGQELEVTKAQYKAIAALVALYPKSIGLDLLKKNGGPGAAVRLSELVQQKDSPWKSVIHKSGSEGPRTGYKLMWPKNFAPSP